MMVSLLDRLEQLKKELTWKPLPEVDFNNLPNGNLDQEQATQMAMDMLSTTPMGGIAAGTKLVGRELLSSLKNKFNKMYPSVSQKGDTFAYPLSDGFTNIYEKTPTLSDAARKKLVQHYMDTPVMQTTEEFLVNPAAHSESLASILGDIPPGYESVADVRFAKLPKDTKSSFQAMFYPETRTAAFNSVEDIINPARRGLDHELAHATTDLIQPAETKFYHNNGTLSPQINQLRKLPQDKLMQGIKNAGPIGDDMNGPLWTILRELRGGMGSTGQRAAWEGRPEEMFAEFVGGAPRTELIRRFNPGANARPVLNNIGNASIDDIFKAIAKESHGGDDLYGMTLEELLGR